MTLPLSVTHIDAHADLGLGDAGYIYLHTELLFKPLEERTNPKRDRELGLTDGNWLAFAIACRWISDLTYVFSTSGPKTREDRPGDLMVTVMEDFDTHANNLQLVAMSRNDLDHVVYRRLDRVEAARIEPKVPFESVP